MIGSGCNGTVLSWRCLIPDRFRMPALPDEVPNREQQRQQGVQQRHGMLPRKFVRRALTNGLFLERRHHVLRPVAGRQTKLSRT